MQYGMHILDLRKREGWLEKSSLDQQMPWVEELESKSTLFKSSLRSKAYSSDVFSAVYCQQNKLCEQGNSATKTRSWKEELSGREFASIVVFKDIWFMGFIFVTCLIQRHRKHKLLPRISCAAFYRREVILLLQELLQTSNNMRPLLIP